VVSALLFRTAEPCDFPGVQADARSSWSDHAEHGKPVFLLRREVDLIRHNTIGHIRSQSVFKLLRYPPKSLCCIKSLLPYQWNQKTVAFLWGLKNEYQSSRFFISEYEPQEDHIILDIDNYDIKTFLSVNPVILTEKRSKYLVNSNLYELVLSLDGLIRETNEAIRGQRAKNVELAEKNILCFFKIQEECLRCCNNLC